MSSPDLPVRIRVPRNTPTARLRETAQEMGVPEATMIHEVWLKSDAHPQQGLRDARALWLRALGWEVHVWSKDGEYHMLAHSPESAAPAPLARAVRRATPTALRRSAGARSGRDRTESENEPDPLESLLGRARDGRTESVPDPR